MADTLANGLTWEEASRLNKARLAHLERLQKVPRTPERRVGERTPPAYSSVLTTDVRRMTKAQVAELRELLNLSPIDGMGFVSDMDRSRSAVPKLSPAY